jgi:nitroreductase
MNKPAITSTPIHDLLARRWSPRAFDAARPVSREQIVALLEAARWAPSCNGDEPWRYLVWNKADDPAGWQQAFDCLTPANQVWVKNVPMLLLSCAGSAFSFNQKPNRWAQHDTGAASMSLVLQAVALGLAAHQMAGYDAEKARAAFGIPEDYTPMAMIAVGYQAAPEVLPDDVKAKEVAARKRQSIAGRFFAGRWGKPVSG